MGDVIKGRFPLRGDPRQPKKNHEPEQKPTGNEGIQQYNVELTRKQSEMLVFFYDLTKSDSRAKYDQANSLLRQSNLKDWKDDDLKQKMLDGYPVVWRADPQWYYALEQELVDRGFLQSWRK